MSFEIKIPLFEGPFDLLLFFIQRDELDIHDIPIHKITKDFLEYIEKLEQLNIEVASEFILVAATLMRIKAKLLLPRVEVDEEGNEVDPRDELVKHLLEYKKYKSVLGVLEDWEDSMLHKEKRGNIDHEIKQLEDAMGVEHELQNVDLYSLMKVFQNCIKKADERNNRPRHQVVPYPYTQEEQQTKILARLSFEKSFEFADVIKEDFNKIAIIYNFLAVLELMAQDKVSIVLGDGFNSFTVLPYEAA